MHPSLEAWLFEPVPSVIESASWLATVESPEETQRIPVAANFLSLKESLNNVCIQSEFVIACFLDFYIVAAVPGIVKPSIL